MRHFLLQFNPQKSITIAVFISYDYELMTIHKSNTIGILRVVFVTNYFCALKAV
jgi:hypothetical protein